MDRPLYPSIAAMIAPAELTALTGCAIERVEYAAIQPENSRSGSQFLAVRTNGGRGPRFYVKRISTEWDWIMRATDDQHGRELRIWQSGALDRLPPGVTHAVIAGAADGAGWALLLRDIAGTLIPIGDPNGARAHARFLEALAALHATYWEGADTPELPPGLCSLYHHYLCLLPVIGHREATSQHAVPPLLISGWELALKRFDPDVAALVEPLLADPSPLAAALARYPHTLIHGDTRVANLGWQRDTHSQIVLIDWQFTGKAPPAVDLAWYLATLSYWLQPPIAPEEAIATYRQRLAGHLGSRFDDGWWQPQLELSLLGGLLRCGWIKAWEAEHSDTAAGRALRAAEFAWWAAQARRAARWL